MAITGSLSAARQAGQWVDGLALALLQLGLKLGNALVECCNHLADRIGQMPVLQQFLFLVLNSDPADRDDAPRDTDNRRVGFDRFDHDRPGPDAHPISDRYVAQHFGARADDHVVAERWMTLGFLMSRTPESDTLVEQHVIADHGGFSDHDPHAVIDEEPPAYRRPGVDLDPGQ